MCAEEPMSIQFADFVQNISFRICLNAIDKTIWRKKDFLPLVEMTIGR